MPKEKHKYAKDKQLSTNLKQRSRKHNNHKELCSARDKRSHPSENISSERRDITRSTVAITRISPPPPKEQSKSPISIQSRLSPIPDLKPSPNRKGRRRSPNLSFSPQRGDRRSAELPSRSSFPKETRKSPDADSSQSPVMDLRRKLERRGLYKADVRNVNDADRSSKLKWRDRRQADTLHETYKNKKRTRLDRKQTTIARSISSDSSHDEDTSPTPVFRMRGFSPYEKDRFRNRAYDPGTERIIVVDR